MWSDQRTRSTGLSKIPPVIPSGGTRQHKGNVSQGAYDDIRVVFGETVPPGFFVKPDTSEMFGSFAIAQTVTFGFVAWIC